MQYIVSTDLTSLLLLDLLAYSHLLKWLNL